MLSTNKKVIPGKDSPSKLSIIRSHNQSQMLNYVK